ncbi:MAG: ABC transporter ATP-binding protein [Peptostreptococcaceae bacterium]|nr:ABC transporter ATP-binding protein [Peptostreptococcaceae bacterium]
MENIICKLSNINKNYKDNKSLDNISLDIYSGEVLGVRGINGAGKSTLLGILAGCIRMDGGKIEFAEGIKNHIAFVPQELSLYNDLTGFENLKFWGLALGMHQEQIKIRSRWLLSQLNLFEKRNDIVSTYSGGMKRRLHLATALMLTPKLLLLDEPTVGADNLSIELITNMIKHLQKQGTTIVLTSHQAGELESMSSRIVTLSLGKIVEVLDYGRI